MATADSCGRDGEVLQDPQERHYDKGFAVKRVCSEYLG
jgi:hypothetical protein